MTGKNHNNSILAPLFNLLGSAEYALERFDIKLARLFRKWSMDQAADTTERYFKLPRIHDVKAFHMPTIGARKKDDYVQWLERGRFTYRDPLYDYTRIFAAFDEETDKWSVIRQRLKVFESEMEAGINHNAGHRIEQFTCDYGDEALALAERLFEEELYQPNPASTPREKRVLRKVMADHHPEGSLMHNIVRRIADREPKPYQPVLPQIAGKLRDFLITHP